MINISRVTAVIFRHLMMIKRPSWVIEITYWTLLDVIIFGSLGKAMTMMAPQSADATAIQALITNVVLWYIVLRGAMTIGFALLGELYDANLIALFSTPLTVVEWCLACSIIGTIGALINVTTGWLVALVMFGCNIFSLGLPIIGAVISLLISSWAVGLILMSVLLFVGKKGTGLAFAICWSLVPLSCVYYPLDVLPPVLQKIAAVLPMMHVFTGIRAHIIHGANVWGQLGISFVLGSTFLVLTIVFFAIMFKRSKNRGLARLELEW